MWVTNQYPYDFLFKNVSSLFIKTFVWKSF